VTGGLSRDFLLSGCFKRGPGIENNPGERFHMMNGITITINLRPLYPGRIGGMETYVRVLLDRWISTPLGKDIDWVLFTNEANSLNRAGDN